AWFFRSVGHGHDVHIAECFPTLAPVTVGENLVAAHLAARLHLPPGGNGPVKEPVEAGHALAGLERLHMFKERGETPDHLPALKRTGDFQKRIEGNPRLPCPPYPRLGGDL